MKISYKKISDIILEINIISNNFEINEDVLNTNGKVNRDFFEELVDLVEVLKEHL